MGLQQQPLGHDPIWAALFGVNQALISFYLAVAEGTVEGVQHQCGFQPPASGKVSSP